MLDKIWLQKIILKIYSLAQNSKASQFKNCHTLNAHLAHMIEWTIHFFQLERCFFGWIGHVCQVQKLDNYCAILIEMHRNLQWVKNI